MAREATSSRKLSSRSARPVTSDATTTSHACPRSLPRVRGLGRLTATGTEPSGVEEGPFIDGCEQTLIHSGVRCGPVAARTQKPGCGSRGLAVAPAALSCSARNFWYSSGSDWASSSRNSHMCCALASEPISGLVCMLLAPGICIAAAAPNERAARGW
eukprot:scaffold119718_cov28-Tisochrysis_lutea.AAC.1